jgi:hypothetical protein
MYPATRSHLRSIDEREDILTEKVPLDANIDIAPKHDSAPPRSRPCREAVVLSTSTHYGWALCGYWDELRPRNGFPTRCIAREDGASVYLFNRRPNKSEDAEAILYFVCGAIVQFRCAPDPVEAVEVVYWDKDKIEGPVSNSWSQS